MHGNILTCLTSGPLRYFISCKAKVLHASESDLPLHEGRIVEGEVERADDRVEDDLLLLQLDVHLQIEQLPGNLSYLRSHNN